MLAGRLKKQQNFMNPQTAMNLIHPLIRSLPSIACKAAPWKEGTLWEEKLTFLGKKLTFLTPGDALATASPGLQCGPEAVS